MSHIAAALLGYLLGSVSGSRIVGRAFALDDLRGTTVIVDGTRTEVDTHGVSASAIEARAGARAGLSAAAIDIAKGVVAVLAARWLFDEPAAAVVTAMAVLVGHVWPIYHRFVGGYGISPLLGVLLVLDWRAIAFAIGLFALLGLIVGSAFLAIETWPLGLVAWFGWQSEPWLIGLALVANALYWWKSWPEAQAAYRSMRADKRRWRDRVADFKSYPDYKPVE